MRAGAQCKLPPVRNGTHLIRAVDAIHVQRRSVKTSVASATRRISCVGMVKKMAVCAGSNNASAAGEPNYLVVNATRCRGVGRTESTWSD